MTESVAIAYDCFDVDGGAERVAIELARTFDAPIYAGFVDEEIPPDDVEVHQVFESTISKLAYNAHYAITDAYHMRAWQECSELSEYDTVIICKNNCGWFVPEDDQSLVWYLHSTPRNLYDRFHENRGGLLRPWFAAAMRALYAPNTRYADAWVCNSELVHRRLRRYWDRDGEVVYPPVPTASFGPGFAETGDYYVTVGRLQRHKRTREIVEAANEQGVPLKVAGTGPEQETLNAVAGDTVDVLGYVSEDRKRELLAGAKAFIFNASNEDFGMTPIEAMASGTPVLGVKDGYTQYQIQDGKNGLVYDRGQLASAIARFELRGVEWSESRIDEWASERFGRRTFREAMRRIVSQAQAQAEINPVSVDQRHQEVVADGGQ